MANHTNPNQSSTRPGVGARIKGVFETAHGIGENVRGRTLGAIDGMTGSGTSGNTHHTSMADRGRMEVETGMARIYGHPDPNAGNAFHNEPSRLPQPTTTGTFGSSHTTGPGPGTGITEDDYYGPSGVGKDTGIEASGYGANDGGARPGPQTVQQQPAIDRNAETGPNPDPARGSLSPNRGPPRGASYGAGNRSPTSQAGTLNPVKQRVGQDFPPELPPRSQAQEATDNDQPGQMYQ